MKNNADENNRDSAYKGFPWTLLNASDVYGPQQAHVYERDESNGVMMTPFDWLLNQIFSF